jgi:hypothetical protein
LPKNWDSGRNERLPPVSGSEPTLFQLGQGAISLKWLTPMGVATYCRSPARDCNRDAIEAVASLWHFHGDVFEKICL